MSSAPSFEITARPIDVVQLASRLYDGDCGAYSSFEGWVRNHNDGRAVTALEYEVFHDLAIDEANRIIDEAIRKYSLRRVQVSHREGALRIGDCAVYIGVTAPHRGEAFAGCRYLIDAIKHRLPIWKKEHYTDGTSEWVNCQHTHDSRATRPAAIDAREFYARQSILPELGASGQERLSEAKVLIVGVGGLGCAAANALAAAGVGALTLADFDRVELSNLHRQSLFAVDDIGQEKAVVAKTKLQARNSLIAVSAYPHRISSENIGELFSQHDLILDCSDNFRTKYLCSDAAVQFGRPVIQASIYRYEGQIAAIDPASEGGCLRCLWPSPPEAGLIGDCAEAGVLGTVPALFGTQQAHMAIMYLLGKAVRFGTQLLTYDMNEGVTHLIERRRNPHCPTCGPEGRADVRDGDERLEIEPPREMPREEFLARFTLVDVREASERESDLLPGAAHMPASGFDATALATDPGRPYLLVCSRGQRSLHAARLLRSAGHKHVFSLRGGMFGLRRLALPEGAHR